MQRSRSMWMMLSARGGSVRPASMSRRLRKLLLNIAACGDTLLEVESSMKDAIDIYLKGVPNVPPNDFNSQFKLWHRFLFSCNPYYPPKKRLNYNGKYGIKQMLCQVKTNRQVKLLEVNSGIFEIFFINKICFLYLKT